MQSSDMHIFKSNLPLYSLYYAEACNEFAGPISASLRPGNTAPFEEMSLRWRAVGNTVSDLTSPRFEPQTSRSRDQRITAWPTGWYAYIYTHKYRMIVKTDLIQYTKKSISTFKIYKAHFSYKRSAFLQWLVLFSECFQLKYSRNLLRVEKGFDYGDI